MLSECRIWDQGNPQAIQLSEIESYLRMAGIQDPYTKLKYARLIRILDEVNLKHLHDKAKQLKK